MVIDFFFFKQKTAYEMRISDWSSDVCSSDLRAGREASRRGGAERHRQREARPHLQRDRRGGGGRGADAALPRLSRFHGASRRPGLPGRLGAALRPERAIPALHPRPDRDDLPLVIRHSLMPPPPRPPPRKTAE